MNKDILTVTNKCFMHPWFLYPIRRIHSGIRQKLLESIRNTECFTNIHLYDTITECIASGDHSLAARLLIDVGPAAVIQEDPKGKMVAEAFIADCAADDSRLCHAVEVLNALPVLVEDGQVPGILWNRICATASDTLVEKIINLRPKWVDAERMEQAILQPLLQSHQWDSILNHLAKYSIANKPMMHHLSTPGWRLLFSARLTPAPRIDDPLRVHDAFDSEKSTGGLNFARLKGLLISMKDRGVWPLPSAAKEALNLTMKQTVPPDSFMEFLESNCSESSSKNPSLESNCSLKVNRNSLSSDAKI